MHTKVHHQVQRQLLVHLHGSFKLNSKLYLPWIVSFSIAPGPPLDEIFSALLAFNECSTQYNTNPSAAQVESLVYSEVYMKFSFSRVLM